MGLFSNVFKPKNQHPEDHYRVTITAITLEVAYPPAERDTVKWNDINTILIVTKDQGPAQPDVWLTLISDEGKCMIPQGAPGYDDVYDIVSKYKAFDFENVIKAAMCTDNKEFLLWSNKTP